jgi:hypothetical protein
MKRREAEETQVPLKKNKLEFDAETDPVCVSVRGYFGQAKDKTMKIGRADVWMDKEGNSHKSGSDLYAFRCKYREDKENGLIQARFQALKHLPQFIDFINVPPVIKTRKNPSLDMLETGLSDLTNQHRNCALHLAVIEAKERLRHALLDLEIASMEQPAEKPTRAGVYVDAEVVVRALKEEFEQHDKKTAD